MLLHELHSEAEMIDIDLVVAPCDPMIGPHSTLLRAAAHHLRGRAFPGREADSSGMAGSRSCWRRRRIVTDTNWPRGRPR